MKKHEIKVGGLYTARVSGRFVTVRVDAITERDGYTSGEGYSRRTIKGATVYAVTNLNTGRKTTFRSAAKFRGVASDKMSTVLHTWPCGCKSPAVGGDVTERCDECRGKEGEQSLPFANSGGPAATESTASVPTDCASVVATDPSSPSEIPTSEPPVVTCSKLATAIAAQMEPVATGMTQQQQDILATAREIEASSGQRVLIVKAGAGTGKTFTCKQLEQVLRGNGQYTAFNSKLVADGKAKFKRAACNTTHSLAFRAVGYKFKHRLGGKRVRSWEVAQRLGIEDLQVALPESIAPYDDGIPQVRRLKAAFLAGQVTTAIRRFCQSADAELGAKHFHRFDGLDEAGSYTNSDKVKAYLMPFAKRAWADMSDPVGTMPFSHDVYVKLWEQSKPVIAADYIMLDEYQDTAPVMVSILQQQRHALLIMVGDDNQRIYEWRGAINAGDEFPGAPSRLLSQSFRFGQVIADVANAVLAGLEQPTDLVMRGLESIPSRVCEVAEPRCYLYRTNAGCIGKLLGEMERGKRGHMIGGTDEVVSFCRAAMSLQKGEGTTHNELGCFEKWSEVQAYAKEDEGQDLRLMVKLIDDFTAEQIIKAMESMPNERDADFICTTAHRSKGLEWPSVRLGQDFRTADKLDDAERRLVYVAATRAQEELDITQCPTFCGGYSKDAEGQVVFVPGLDIEYTVPMPTTDELKAYRVAKSTPKIDSVVNIDGKMYMQENKTAPILRDADGNTWAKGKNGDWLVRGKPGQQGTITVFKRNGERRQVTVKRVVWQDASAALYEV